jgi:hypothetical protein
MSKKEGNLCFEAGLPTLRGYYIRAHQLGSSTHAVTRTGKKIKDDRMMLMGEYSRKRGV